jgi:hypothetical protein
MPAAVAAYISTATLTAASVVTAAQITAMTYAAFAVGSVAVGNHQRRKAKAKALAGYNAGLEDRLVTVPTTMGARSRCYGRVRNVDGPLFRGTRGANKEFYTMFLAVAGHEIDAFETVYFKDDPVTLDGSGWVQTAPYAKTDKASAQANITLNGSGAGTLTASYVAGTSSATYASGGIGEAAGEFTVPTTEGAGTISITGGPAGAVVTINYQATTVASKARVRFYTGAPGQNVGAVLAADFPGLVTATDHRFAGIAGLLIDLEYDPDVFPTGVPPITAVFRGAKVFDPRTSTTAWTQNPALIARDWALNAYGGGCVAADLVAASFTAAANVCDTSTTITVGGSSTTMPAFTCGIVAKLGDDDPWQVLLEVVESMAGKTGWTGGQLRVVAGSYRSPVETITEDWLTDKDDIQIIPEPPADEAVNLYRAQIADSAQRYNVVQAPEVRAATYVTADGRELPREITLGGVTDTNHAQHVCSIMLRDARNSLSVVLPLNLRAFRLELFDVVSITLPRFGWAAKTFEVVDWRFSLSGGVVLTLKETAAAIFTPDSTFAVLDVTPNTALPNPFNVPVVGPLTITSSAAALQDGTSQTRVQVSWTVPADRAVTGSGDVEIQYWPAATALPSGDWLAAPPVPGNAATTTLTGLRAGVVYVLRARFVNALGLHGQWGVQAVHRVAEVQAAEFAATRVWQWSAGTVDGWTAAGATLTPSAGSLTITATGTDPVLRIAGLTINGAQNTRVRMRLRRLAGAGWDGSLFYTTAGHAESSSFVKVIPNMLPAGPFLILEWDMSKLTTGGTDWTSSTITGLRFDLGNANGDSFQIDWVAVGYIGPATEGAVWGQTLAGQPADADLLNSYQVIGMNRLSESDQPTTVRFLLSDAGNGASIDAGAVRYPEAAGWTTANFVLQGGRTRNSAIRQVGRHTGTVDTNADGAGNTVAVDMVFDSWFPVIAGERIAASCYLLSQRCTTLVYLAVYDAAGTLLAAPPFGSAAGVLDLARTTATTVQANILSNYQRPFVIATMPASAARARMIVRKYNTQAGQSDSWVFATAPQVEAVAANATGPSPYSPGPVAAIGTDQLSEFASTKISTHIVNATQTFLSGGATTPSASRDVVTSFFNANYSGRLQVTCNFRLASNGTGTFDPSLFPAYPLNMTFWVGTQNIAASSSVMMGAPPHVTSCVIEVDYVQGSVVPIGLYAMNWTMSGANSIEVWNRTISFQLLVR